MKTHATTKEIPDAEGDDRLIDAMLHELARLGTQADAPFLQRLDHSISGASVVPFLQRRAQKVVIGSVAAAAAIALIAGLVWNNMPSEEVVHFTNGAAEITDGIVLSTAFPPELIEGTPRPMNVPRLVAAPSTAPTLMVPKGTELLSLGKPVTSSDENPIIGSLDLVTDGEKDAGEGYFVELMDGLQWVQIDLAHSAEIRAVWLWHFHSQRRAYHDVIVQVSDDPTFKTGAATIYNNDYDNSAGMGKGSDNPYVETRFGLLINAKGAPGRYVRLYSNGNTSNEMNHYIEVEVFGLRK